MMFLPQLLLILLSISLTASTTDGGITCLKDPLDIYLIIDTSGSIAQVFGAYENELDWARQLSEVLLGSTQNRIGVLGFNEKVYPQFELTSSLAQMNENIEFMRTCFECQPHGRTATHLALQAAEAHLMD